jgi:hypothetical protein
MAAPERKPAIEYCPACKTVVSPRWNACPMCDVRLRGPCPRCGKSDAAPLAPRCPKCAMDFLTPPKPSDDDVDED